MAKLGQAELFTRGLHSSGIVQILRRDQLLFRVSQKDQFALKWYCAGFCESDFLACSWRDQNECCYPLGLDEGWPPFVRFQ